MFEELHPLKFMKETPSPFEVAVFGCRRVKLGVESRCNKVAIYSKALLADCGACGVRLLCLFARRFNKSSADRLMCSS